MTEETPRFRNRPVLLLVTSHWLAQVGLGLVLTAIVTWLFLIPVRLRDGGENPYIGIAAFAVVPSVLLLGLILTPIGLRLGRRRAAAQIAAGITEPKVALRRLFGFLSITLLFNVVIGTQVTYRALHHMESRQFCGSCHVMTPEARAIDPGPHAGLQCVECHVGNGALGLLESKMQGTHQLISVLTDSVQKPIASAIESGKLVPSAETCEECHWKDRLGTVRLKIIKSFAEDEKNTPETTVLTMQVGGSVMGGIHGAHNAEGVRIRFVATDAKRQDIPLVEYENTLTGERRTYVRAGANAADYEGQPRITMECVDCHNRAAHAFQPADDAVDHALTLGRLPSTLPFLKKKGLEILRAGYESTDEAARKIPAALTDFYRSEHPKVLEQRAGDVEQAGRVLAEIHSRNVYPELGITWGTYPDNRGHQEFPGCFRCHEGKHATESGEEIEKNCFRCHTASAVDEASPEILRVLGLSRPIEEMRSK